MSQSCPSAVILFSQLEIQLVGLQETPDSSAADESDLDRFDNRYLKKFTEFLLHRCASAVEEIALRLIDCHLSRIIPLWRIAEKPFRP
ncbi:MAG: hypothetical protein GY696_33285 [Gammaproteobacteria bacterium]|nr:hypothetical protein [Gammaproteobacteria bacterium]